MTKSLQGIERLYWTAWEYLVTVPKWSYTPTQLSPHNTDNIVELINYFESEVRSAFQQRHPELASRHGMPA